MAEDDKALTVSLSNVLAPYSAVQVAMEMRQVLVNTLAAAAKREWQQLARQNLRTFRASYTQAIQDPDIADGMATVVLAGSAANRIENGYAAYDMHDTLLGDKVPVIERGSGGKGKCKNKKGGFYRFIPFRHATPGSEGEVGAPMGSAFDKSVGQDVAAHIGAFVYGIAKQMTPSVADGGRTSWQSVRSGGKTRMDITDKLKPHHSGSIYGGMYKVQKQYNKTTQNQYVTFRTIATGSRGWQVAAQPGKHFAPQVAEYVTGIAQATLDGLIEAANQAAPR